MAALNPPTSYCRHLQGPGYKHFGKHWDNTESLHLPSWELDLELQEHPQSAVPLTHSPRSPMLLEWATWACVQCLYHRKRAWLAFRRSRPARLSRRQEASGISQN